MDWIAPLLALVPYMRAHRHALIAGAMAAAGVVVLRLALPWPFRMVLEPMLAGSDTLTIENIPVSWLEMSPVWLAGTAFFLLVAVLGWADHGERLHFARFAIGLVKDLRAQAFSGFLDEKRPDHERPPGDLVARLVGDTARIKAGLKGFMVHVATNVLMFGGVVIILLWMDLLLGLVFAIAGSLTILTTLIGAGHIYRCAGRHRRKEGKMAEAINAVDTAVISEKELSRINGTSERYEAQVTRLQGRTTLAAHVFLGIAVVVALLVGWRGFVMGRLAAGDLFICMAYLLMLRAPMVQLTRQGARTGKISAAVERVMALIRDGEHRLPKAHRPPRDWLRLRLNKVKIRAARRNGRRRRIGPLNLVVERGEHIAILGAPGSGKSTLLAMIAGKVRPKKGDIDWETDAGRPDGLPRETQHEIALSPQHPVWSRRPLGSFLGIDPKTTSLDQIATPKGCGLGALMKRLPDGLDSRVSAHALSIGERKMVSALRVLNAGAVIKLFDDPAAQLSLRRGARLIEYILGKAAGDTVLISFNRASAISVFGRVIKLRRGKIVFDGTPEQWRQRRMEKSLDLRPSLT